MTTSLSQVPSVSNTAMEESTLTEQVVRLQALLEASRCVHSTINRVEVLEGAARIAVRELEMEGVLFTHSVVTYGDVPPDMVETDHSNYPQFELRSRSGELLSVLVVATPGRRPLNLYEQDFLDGLALQTAVALENAINHQRHMEYARLAQDLDAARSIQQSLLPQSMPVLHGYSISARSRACYQVGGDYFDVVTEQGGSYLFVIADVAGKGLASALICTAFRSAFRALAQQMLPLEELACRLSQQHWDEGMEARRRYVTALFVRLHPVTGAVEFLNAGHNPAFLATSAAGPAVQIRASGTPLGLLPGATYATERRHLEPGARLLLYTDGLTEVFHGEEEFGEDGLETLFTSSAIAPLAEASDAAGLLELLWATLDTFSGGAPQQDDMSAISLCRNGSLLKERA